MRGACDEEPLSDIELLYLADQHLHRIRAAIATTADSAGSLGLRTDARRAVRRLKIRLTYLELY